MKLGVALPVAGPWARPESIRTIAVEGERLGYESLWTFQRLLYAEEPKNDYPPMADEPWPAAFQSVMEPLGVLAYVAAITQRPRLGVAVLNLPFSTPIVLAKQTATLDILSGGRLDVGVGLGWSQDEYAAVGVPYSQRGARTDEFLRCLKAIWTDPVVEFHGEFYVVPRARVEPRPMQRPHPPVLVGGYVPASVRRVVELGDGFVGGNVPLDEVTPLVRRLHEAAREHGRDARDLRIVSRGTVQLHDTPQGPNRRPLWGTFHEITEDIVRYAEAGLTELFLEFNFDPRIGGEADVPAALERALALMQTCAASHRPR